MTKQNALGTNFWSYLVNTYKKSGYLILIGIITAVYLTVSSVFANRMDLPELTYFNAMVSLAYFSHMIGFGVSGGISLYMNQNHTNKQKVAHYAKLGLYLVTAVSFLFVAAVVLLKPFIVSNLLRIDTLGNNTFYYLMAIYMFFNCIRRYLLDIFKNLKLFRLQTAYVVLYSVLIVSSFVALWFLGALALNWIGLAYLVTAMLPILIGLLFFAKNKLYPINFLKPTKFDLTKKELATIFYMAASEIVWQVGYMLTALFLLRMSELYFNTYSYYENALDLFNTFYFSFIVIVSIEITRSLGQGKFDEAYQHGKYSIYFSVLIWVAYAIISFALMTPINSGLNVDLQSIGTVAMLLYVLIYLPRFVVWNLTTYVLIWGGQVKLQFFIELASMLYYVVLMFIYPYLPNSIYWAYFFISLDYLIKLPIELCIFKSKKWLVNITEPTLETDNTKPTLL